MKFIALRNTFAKQPGDKDKVKATNRVGSNPRNIISGKEKLFRRGGGAEDKNTETITAALPVQQLSQKKEKE